MTDVDNPKDRRVKVYQLNGDGQWDDKGTGQIVLSGVPEEQTFEMSVSCEDTNAQLMEHRVVREVDYARQGETIITWCQADNPDLALSFQEAAGCSDVWNKIVAVIGQRDDQDSNGTLQGGHQVEPIQLPEPRLENVESILKVIAESPTNNRELVASALLQDDYLKKLLDVFEQVDQSGDSKTAILFFELFKQTVLLNEISIYEVLFSDEIFKPMLSVFDHDPTMREENKMQHRTFWSRAQFKPIMDIKDQSLVKKIHQNYRMTYFKDVVLLRFLDDCALNTLGSLIYYNNATIISHITEHPELVGSIFKKINEAALSIRNFVDSKDSKGDQKGSPSDCLAKDPFLFMQELCGIVKNLQVPQRDAFYNTLVEASVFQSVEDALWAAAPRDYPWVWQSSVEILQNMLIHDSALMRSFLVSRIPSDRSLLARLVTMIVSEEVTPGLVHQLGEILRMVLDPDAMQTDDKDIFLDHFYAKNVACIDKALTQTTEENFTKYNALELLSMCAKQHGYRAKQYILDHGILQKATKMLEFGDKQLTLSVIRLIRMCLGTKDPGYAKCVEKNRLLDPIIDLFVANGARYNLLNSNVIELLDLIHRENIKNLISYVMREHGAKFEKVRYVDTFRHMAVQHENNTSQDSAIVAKDEKAVLADGMTEDSNCEYTYFEGGDDEDEKAPPMDLEDENDGFVPRKAMEEDDKEEDLMTTITKRQKTGKLRSRMRALPKKITVNRKSSLDSSPMSPAESPRKKRRVDEVGS